MQRANEVMEEYIVALKSSWHLIFSFQMNKSTWGISVAGIGSIHDITSEQVLSLKALLSLSAVCFYILLLSHI
jgi:hypothetical protein